MNLVDNVCNDKEVNGIPFSAKIVSPKGAANARTLKKLRSKSYIVVHNTGNTASSAGDEAHANYIQNVENADTSYVSWHITVDCDSATQHLPFDEVGFHAGDGKGDGNYASIGIEIAENKNYEQAEQNAIRIICALMKKFNISVDNVLPHRFFATNKKLCPHKILKSQNTWNSDWKKFQEKVATIYDNIYCAESKNGVTYKVQVGAFSVKDNAKNLQLKLSKAGYSTYVVKVGSMYKVQVGAFSNKQNAENLHRELVGKNFASFVTSTDAVASGTAVLGKKLSKGSVVTVAKTATTYYGSNVVIPQWVKEKAHTIDRETDIYANYCIVGSKGGINSKIATSDLILKTSP